MAQISFHCKTEMHDNFMAVMLFTNFCDFLSFCPISVLHLSLEKNIQQGKNVDAQRSRPCLFGLTAVLHQPTV
jgi:hypothetical protein